MLRYNCLCSTKKNRIVAVMAALFFVYELLFYWRILQLPNPHHQQELSAAAQLNPDHEIIILYWTKFFNTNDFEVGLGSKPFSSCEDVKSLRSCLTTTDRNLLNKSDAVIFHARDMRENDLPPPEWRLSTQHFVFLLYESPVHTDLELLRRPMFTNYFNTTMTYRRDSDIVDLHPYGRIKCIDPSSSSCLNFPLVNGTAVQEISPSSTVFSALKLKSKKLTVAWFVSNCNTNGRRESLVKKLSNFIPVDIYGKCSNGNSSCPNETECDKMLSQYYRFYLSFENSLCPDYVTEKLYRPMAHDTVPVVFGGTDYSLYLPKGSYINAMDYKSPKDLANYLKKLMTDDELYLSYFHWKAKYEVRRSPLDGWCHLCRMLRDFMPHIWHNYRKKDKTYIDMAAWWSGQTTNQTCLSAPKFLV